MEELDKVDKVDKVDTLGVLMPAYRRPEVVLSALEAWQEAARTLRGSVNIRLHIIISPESDPLLPPTLEAFTKANRNLDMTVALYEAPNSPLSDKWNTGLHTFEHLEEVSFVMQSGSDDLVTAPYVLGGVGAIGRGGDFVQPSGLYFYDVLTGGAFYAYLTSVGTGTFFSRSLLDRLSWNVWPRGRNRGVDAALKDGIRGRVRSAVCVKTAVDFPTALHRSVPPSLFVDVKSHTIENGAPRLDSINSYAAMHRSFHRKGSAVEPRLLRRHFPGSFLHLDLLRMKLHADIIGAASAR